VNSEALRLFRATRYLPDWAAHWVEYFGGDLSGGKGKAPDWVSLEGISVGGKVSKNRLQYHICTALFVLGRRILAGNLYLDVL